MNDRICPDCGHALSSHDLYKDGRCPVVAFRPVHADEVFSAEELVEIVTGDDPATCALCGKETSIAMIARHLHDEHDVAYEDIADAEIIEVCPSCGHSDSHHDERGCDVDGCECAGP